MYRSVSCTYVRIENFRTVLRLWDALYTRMYTDELKISSFGRTNTARGGSLSTARGLPSTRIFIRVSRRLSTLFSVLPAAPRLDTIGVTRQHRKTRRETRNAVVKFRSNDATLVPSVMLVKLSSLSFFISLFLSLSFFLKLCILCSSVFSLSSDLVFGILLPSAENRPTLSPSICY